MTAPTTDLGLLDDADFVSAVSGGMLDLEVDGHAAALRRVAGWVRTYCRWHVFGVRDESLTVDGSHSRQLHLPTLRVVDITSVVEDSWDGLEVVGSEREWPRDFTWSKHGVLEKRSGCWTRERRGVTVTLTHGFDQPEDLLGIIVGAAVRHSTAPDGNPLARVGDIAYQSSGAGAAGGAAFLQSEYAVLDHYRLNSEA